jgi:hypothetical protein
MKFLGDVHYLCVIMLHFSSNFFQQLVKLLVFLKEEDLCGEVSCVALTCLKQFFNLSSIFLPPEQSLLVFLCFFNILLTIT